MPKLSSVPRTPLAPLSPDALVVRPNKACELLGCTRPVIYKLINEGRLTAYKEGCATLITIDSIRKHIADRLKHQALEPREK